jgi:hypothetical protein
VFSVGGHIRDWNLLRYIILLYLSRLFRILVLSEGLSLLALVGTEKVGMRSADLSGYSVGSHLSIFHFDTFYGMRSSDPWLVQCRLPFISDLLIHE